MTDKEKISALESLLRNQLKWFDDASSKEHDDSYAYDMVEEQFGRGETYQILNILSK